jgi:regulator of RNase E activity RraA
MRTEAPLGLPPNMKRQYAHQRFKCGVITGCKREFLKTLLKYRNEVYQMDREKMRAAFAKISTGDIADAMVTVGVLPHTIIGLHSVVPNQQPTAGYALTVKQMVRSVNRTETSLAKHGMVIDTMLKAGDVLVVDVGGRMDVCTGGALLALRAKNVGSQGFIINGCMRDLDDIAKIGFRFT